MHQIKVSTNGSTFVPLYNGLEDSYVIDSIGYRCINGVLEGHLTISGVTTLFQPEKSIYINGLKDQFVQNVWRFEGLILILYPPLVHLDSNSYICPFLGWVVEIVF